jgi:hypothetical protein
VGRPRREQVRGDAQNSMERVHTHRSTQTNKENRGTFTTGQPTLEKTSMNELMDGLII